MEQGTLQSPNPSAAMLSPQTSLACIEDTCVHHTLSSLFQGWGCGVVRLLRSAKQLEQGFAAYEPQSKLLKRGLYTGLYRGLILQGVLRGMLQIYLDQGSYYTLLSFVQGSQSDSATA